jgi:hypothetical protein
MTSHLQKPAWMECNRGLAICQFWQMPDGLDKYYYFLWWASHPPLPHVFERNNCSDSITFQNAIVGKTLLWKLRPLVLVKERRVSAFCRYNMYFPTLNIQLNSNNFTAKIFDMAMRYGVVCVKCVPAIARAYAFWSRVVGCYFRTLHLLLYECMTTSSGYYI